jgi:hypothetical protein
MASGTLGQSAPAATTNTTVYTVPGGVTATLNINIVNRGATTAVVRIAIAATGTPANSEYVEYDVSIEANAVLERSGFVLSAGKNVVVFSSTADTSVNVYGYEE